jgi:hypothetical protein
MSDQTLKMQFIADVSQATPGMRVIKRDLDEINAAADSAGKKGLNSAKKGLDDVAASSEKAAGSGRTIKRSLEDIGSSSQGMTNSLGLAEAATGLLSFSWAKLAATIAAGFSVNKIIDGFMYGINVVDNFIMSIARSAAMIVSLNGFDSGNLTKDYAAAKQYAEGIYLVLQKVDAQTSLNIGQLQSMNEEFIKQGVYLNANNKNQVDGYTMIANAAAVYMRSGGDEMQLRQEVGAMLRGEATIHDQLGRMIQGQISGPLSEWVKKHKEAGDLIEAIGEKLRGFGPANADIASTWRAVTSSIKTALDVMLNSGFSSIFKDVVGYAGEIQAHLVAHKDLIVGGIQSAWERVKGIVSDLAPAVVLVGSLLSLTVIPLLKEMLTLVEGTAKGINLIATANFSSSNIGEYAGLLTALGIAAYYAVGGITAMTIAYNGFMLAVTASMATNPIGWFAAALTLCVIAAKPLAEWLDKILQKFSGLTEATEKDISATNRWNEARMKAKWMRDEGGLAISPGLAATIAPPVQLPKAPASPADKEAALKAKKAADAAAEKRLEAIAKEDAATAALWAKQQDHLRETAVGLTKEQAAGEKIWTTYNNQLAALDKMNPSYKKNVAIIDQIAATSFNQLKIQTDYQTGLDKEKKSLEDAAEAEKTRLQREQQKLAAMQLQYRINKETAQTQYKTEDMNISMMNDPYAQQQASLEARYERERTLIEEKQALSQQGSALEKAQMEELATLQIKLNHDMTASKKSATAEAWQGVFASSKKAIPQLAMFDKLIAASQKDYIVKGKDGVVDQTKSNLSMYSSYAGAAGSLFEGLAATQDQTSRKGFESAKAFNMAAAVMSTAAAVMNALATVQPYPMALAAAAMAAATGVIQIATIASTSFGGSGSVSAPAGSIASVGGGGGNSLANVAIPKNKLEDTVITTREELLASSIDRNSVVVGRLSTSMENLGTLFKEGGAGSRLAINAPGRFNNTTGSSSWVGGDKWRVTGGGMALGFSDGEMSASEFTRNSKRGGFFSGSRSSTTFNPNDQLDKYMTAIMTPFITDLTLMADTIGTAFDVKSFNQGMTMLDTAGKSEDEIGKAVEAYIRTTLQGMTLTIPGIEKLGGSFDDLYARIIAVNNAFVTANEQLQKIGDNPIDFGKTGDAILAVAVDMENAIASLYGGIEGYNKAMDAYREVMYTQPQRDAQDAANAQRTVNAKWAAIQKETGLVLPDTIAGFNALRNTIDPASPLYHALTMLGPEFAKIKIAAEEATKTTNTWIVREMQAAGKDTTLFELRLTQEEEMRTAAESGLDVQRLRILQDKEWAQAVEGVTGTVKKSVSTLNDLANAVVAQVDKQTAVLNHYKSITSTDASLSPETKYQKAQEAFNTAYTSKNYDTISAASDALLAISREYNASGAAYQTDFQKVTEALRIMGSVDPSKTVDQNLALLKDIRDGITGPTGTNSALGDLSTTMAAFNTAMTAQNKTNAAETYTRSVANYSTNTADTIAAYRAGTNSVSATQTALDSALIPVTTAYNNAVKAGNTDLNMINAGISFVDTDARMKNKASSIATYQGAYNPNYDIAPLQNGVVYKDGIFDSEDRIIWQRIAEGFYNWSGLRSTPNSKMPAFDTGTPSVPYDMTAKIHQGEIIMDRASSDVLRKYGIPTNGSADNKETIAELKETNRLQAEQLKILMAMLTVNQAGLIRVAEATEKTAEATDGMEQQTRLKATA